MSKSVVNLGSIGKYDYEKVQTLGKTFFICGTCLPYDDLFWGFAEQALEKFGYDTNEACENGQTPRIRDAFIEAFQKIMNCEFCIVNDTY